MFLSPVPGGRIPIKTGAGKTADFRLPRLRLFAVHDRDERAAKKKERPGWWP